MLKEIKLSPNIGKNDIEYRVKQANKFLEKGDQVKITLSFKGREKAHIEIGRATISHFINECDRGTLVNTPKETIGKRMFITATLNPKGKGK